MAGHYLRIATADVYSAVYKLVEFLTGVVGWDVAEDVSDTGDIRDVVLKSTGEPEVPNGLPRYIRIRSELLTIQLYTYETFISTTSNTGEVSESTFGKVTVPIDGRGFELVIVADLERVILNIIAYTGASYYGYVGRITAYHTVNDHNYPNIVKGGSATNLDWYLSSSIYMIGPDEVQRNYTAVEPLNNSGLTAGSTSDRDGSITLAAPVIINDDADPQKSELAGEPRGVYRVSPEVTTDSAFITIDGEVYAVTSNNGKNFANGPVGIEVPSLSPGGVTIPPRAPKRVDSMIAHWDDTTIVSVSGTVTGWTDKTGNGWDLVPGTTAPLHLVADQNGLDTVDCNSVGYMDLDVTGGAPIAGSNPGTIYVVLITDSAPGVNARGVYDFTDGTGNHHPWTTDTLFTQFGNTSRRQYGQSPAGVVHNWHIFTGVGAVGNNTFEINGIVQFTTIFNSPGWRPAGASPWVIGGGLSGAYQGRIGEVRLYDTEHDTTTRDLVTQLLKAKWGIA